MTDILIRPLRFFVRLLLKIKLFFFIQLQEHARGLIRSFVMEARNMDPEPTPAPSSEDTENTRLLRALLKAIDN